MINNNKLAFVFPGQGSQSVGMLAEIAQQFKEVQQTFDAASAVLGYDLWQLTQTGPAEELDKTAHTQPALLAASFAIWRILQSRTPLHPTMLAGHSLGEYTALVCANALKFEDAIKLVAARGQFMQEAVAPGLGSMAAIIGLDEATVDTICRQALTSSDDVLSPANFNSTGQVVIAGHRAAVERAMILAKQQRAKLTITIPVSVPSHCKLMQPAAFRLEKLLSTISFATPSIPVMNNVDVLFYGSADAIRDGLVRQLFMPVRWVEIIQHFTREGMTHIIECGPGKVLTGLIKRIDKNLQTMTTSDASSLETLLKLENERSV